MIHISESRPALYPITILPLQIKIIECVLHRENLNFRIPKDLLKPFGATLTHGYRAFLRWIRIHKDSKKGGGDL